MVAAVTVKLVDPPSQLPKPFAAAHLRDGIAPARVLSKAPRSKANVRPRRIERRGVQLLTVAVEEPHTSVGGHRICRRLDRNWRSKHHGRTGIIDKICIRVVEHLEVGHIDRRTRTRLVVLVPRAVDVPPIAEATAMISVSPMAPLPGGAFALVEGCDVATSRRSPKPCPGRWKLKPRSPRDRTPYASRAAGVRWYKGTGPGAAAGCGAP